MYLFCSKQKAALSKCKNLIGDKEEHIHGLEEKLHLEQNEQKSRLNNIQEEVG